MSILGYSSSYFLPDYWANTPLYGEKLIPLFDYILSNDYEHADKMAQAFYDIQNKYKNVQDLPIDKVQAIIDESGYSYVRALLGNDEDSTRLLLTLMTLIHQLKGTKLGIQVVLNLLKKDDKVMVMQVVGNPTINTTTKDISNITTTDYVLFSGLLFDTDSPVVSLKIRTGDFNTTQTIMSSNAHGFYLGIDTDGKPVLSLGSNRKSWNIIENKQSTKQLTANTEYYVQLEYNGYEYNVNFSTDNKKFTTYINVASSTPVGINNGVLYLGVDGSISGTISKPFSGYVNFSNLSLNVSNTEITQWFEQTPVGNENTFMIKTDLDVELVSADFFNNFTTFIKNYVYPSLQAFTAKLNFNTNLSFIPYVRQKVTYAAVVGTQYVNMLVKTTTESEEATDPFLVDNGYSSGIDFLTKI